MEAGKTTFERRLNVLFYLIQYRKSTIVDMAKYFGVHRNTAYKDVVFLSHYAPIYTKSGIGGGVYLLDSYRNGLFPYLSVDEVDVLKKILPHLTPQDRYVVKNIINKCSLPIVSNT